MQDTFSLGALVGSTIISTPHEACEEENPVKTIEPTTARVPDVVAYFLET